MTTKIRMVLLSEAQQICQDDEGLSLSS